MAYRSGITTAVGGASMGRPPLGPPGPGVEPLHPRIVARYFNILRYRFAEEFAYHKQVLAPAMGRGEDPAGLQFVARVQQSVQPQARGIPPVAGMSPDWGYSYIGAQEGRPIPT